MDIRHESGVEGEIAELGTWLVAEARHLQNVPSILDALVKKLRVRGMPVSRLMVAYPTLHSETRTLRFLWEDRSNGVAETPLPHGIEETDLYKKSPYRLLDLCGHASFRADLRRKGPLEFAMYEELRAEGHTDFVGFPLEFSRCRPGVISWCTRNEECFSDAQIAAFETLVTPLTTILEVHLAWDLTATLLDTYLGPGAGPRVLTGQTKRGSTESINAVIWYSDMRGFTDLSNRLPGPYLIASLNDFFEALAEPVHTLGGEVLKFIGDAMLAVFRIDDKTSDAEACETALTAAEMAVHGIRRLNRRRQSEGKSPLEFGLALHIGDVMFGNVGAPTRLDFTVTGPAVNLATRIESLTGQIGHRLLLSSAFVERCPGQFTSHGRFVLKGIKEPQEVFTTA